MSFVEWRSICGNTLLFAEAFSPAIGGSCRTRKVICHLIPLGIPIEGQEMRGARVDAVSKR